MSGSSLRPSQMSGNGRETLPNIWEALSDVWECSESPPRCPVSPSRISGSGREALSNVKKWSGGSLGCPGVVGRPSWMIERGRETLPNVRKDLMDIQ